MALFVARNQLAGSFSKGIFPHSSQAVPLQVRYVAQRSKTPLGKRKIPLNGAARDAITTLCPQSTSTRRSAHNIQLGLRRPARALD